MKTWLIAALFCSCLQAQDPPPQTIGHILDVLRERVQRLETSVPNFVCKERIVSQSFANDKLKKETQAQSVLTTTRSTSEGRGIFSEARAEMRIDGKPTKRSGISGPFVWNGGPAYGDLHYLFNSDHGIECRDYKLLGTVKLDGKDALLITTHVLADKTGACHDLPPGSADKIWLEPLSLNVLRIESVDPPVKNPTPGLTLTVDYMPVVFDGAEYWLPAHFISRLDLLGLNKHMQYEAFFSDYHKYGAQSVIRIDDAQ